MVKLHYSNIALIILIINQYINNSILLVRKIYEIINGLVGK